MSLGAGLSLSLRSIAVRTEDLGRVQLEQRIYRVGENMPLSKYTGPYRSAGDYPGLINLPYIDIRLRTVIGHEINQVHPRGTSISGGVSIANGRSLHAHIGA